MNFFVELTIRVRDEVDVTTYDGAEPQTVPGLIRKVATVSAEGPRPFIGTVIESIRQALDEVEI